MQSASRAGRPQRPVDPGAGPGQQLALALRELREDSGNPTYRAMAERAHYSASALARAASGTAFPGRDLVLAYARSCGGDEAEWDQRWAAAAAQAGLDGEPEHAHRQDQQAPEPHVGTRRRRPRRLAIAAAASAAVAALTAGILLMPGPRHPAPHPPASRPSASAAAGSSQPARPAVARCVAGRLWRLRVLPGSLPRLAVEAGLRRGRSPALVPFGLVAAAGQHVGQHQVAAGERGAGSGAGQGRGRVVRPPGHRPVGGIPAVLAQPAQRECQLLPGAGPGIHRPLRPSGPAC